MELAGISIILVNAEKGEALEIPKKREIPMAQSMIRFRLGHIGVRVKNLYEAARVFRHKGARILNGTQGWQEG